MISSGVAVEGAGGGYHLGFPPEFLRPLPPRFRPPVPPPRLPPLSLPTPTPAKDEEPDFPSYRLYPPYYPPYLYPYPLRPLDYYSPPQSPLRPPKPPPTPAVRRAPTRRARAARAAGFARGSLIRLASGELRRVEEMRTEDFISSAEHCPALRLDPSTVVRIDSTPDSTSAVLTLRYGESRSQVEVESSLEQPYFVYGQGWASCRPERTLARYGLKCHLLQVGDVCISLSPRPTNDRKRRWSAPDQLDPSSSDQPADL